MTKIMHDITELTAHLGHAFKDAGLLQEALTHPSLAGPKQRKKNGTAPYERLEFLGDRVLGLIVAEWIYKVFPESSEGDLAKRHASLVNRDALHVVAKKIGLDHHLMLAHGEEVSMARKNLVTLSDALEALIGALYLDGGLDVCRRFIQKYWQEATMVEAAPADPKTALQEWAQSGALPLPVYKMTERSGPAHAPKFRIQVVVKGCEPVEAEGDSKRLAEKAAAQALLNRLAGEGKYPQSGKKA